MAVAAVVIDTPSVVVTVQDDTLNVTCSPPSAATVNMQVWPAVALAVVPMTSRFSVQVPNDDDIRVEVRSDIVPFISVSVSPCKFTVERPVQPVPVMLPESNVQVPMNLSLLDPELLHEPAARQAATIKAAAKGASTRPARPGPFASG